MRGYSFARTNTIGATSVVSHYELFGSTGTMSLSLERPYPTRNGIIVPPQELDLPESELNPRDKHNRENHHGWYTRRKLAKTAIGLTLREISYNQFILLIDTHAALHRLYAPPELPTIDEAMEQVMDAYDAHAKLKRGSANNPVYFEISEGRMQRIIEEYNNDRF